MAANDWQIGALYPLGKGLNGIAWQQPDGPGGLVFPQQQTGVDFLSIQPFNERTGIFQSGCGHAFNAPLVQREFDYNTNESVALILCPLCGFLIYTLEPFESALDTVQQPVLPA